MFMTDKIEVDNRVAECLSVLSTVMSKTDLSASYIVIYPSNDFYCISDETVIFHSIIINTISDISTLYIDVKKTLVIQGILEEVEIDENGEEVVKETKNKKKYSPAHYIALTDIFKKYMIDTNLTMYNDYNKYQVILSKDNFSESEEFSPYRNMKADQGSKMYKNYENDNFICFPVFSGFPKLSKSDSMSLVVYKQDEKYNLIRYIIYKKKLNRNINILYRVINLNI